jgi:serine/threonine protein kinase/Flp pilus assembly protein TadD
MTPERYKEVGRLYRGALEIEPEQRAAYLAHACGGDEALRQEVESLLDYEAQGERMIDRPALEAAARTLVKDQAASPPLSLIGQRIGHFQILSLLGAGGMGEVWLAEDTRLSRKVAVKMLPPEFTVDAGRMRRFALEARTASALSHPNIVMIHEIGEAGKTHFIVAEYVEGETLRQRLMGAPDNRIKPAEAIDLAAQVAAALTAAHEAGIVHRDIKPENAMVRRDGILKVLDFGLAKLTETIPPVAGSQVSTRVGNSTEAGVVMGTPSYMSPEQARGEKVDARSDIFSLGVVLYEMIAGRAPFAGTTTSEVIAAILRDLPPPLAEAAPGTLPGLERIITRALRKDRAERYQTAKDLLGDLNQLKEQLLMEKLVPAGSESSTRAPVPPAAKTINKRRRTVLVALAAIIVSLAAVAWFYFNRSGPPPAKDTVMLADFDNQTGDDIFDGTLKQGLATQLEQSNFLNVFPEVRVRQTLQQMERATDTRVTRELAQEICERQNLKAFIAGSIAPLGNHFVITLAALQGRSGEELARAQVTASSKEQVLQALAEAATQLRAKLGESLSSIQQSGQPLEQAMTANLQALKAYSAGRNLNIAARFTEALPLLRRAAELDPQFTNAYDQLTIVCWATERPEAAAEYQAKIVRLQEERAAQSKNPVSEWYKLDITTWYERLVTGNLQKSSEILLARRQMYPRSLPVVCEVGTGYVLSGQPEQALTPLNECISLNRNFAAPYKWLAVGLTRLNRFSEAKDTLTQALQLKLDFTAFHTQLYQLAFISADEAGMQGQIDWAQNKPDEYVALDWQTGAAAFTGQWRNAQDFSRRAIDLAARDDNRELASRYATEQALRSAALGDFRLAKANVARGLALGRGRIPLSRSSLALALCGETSQAKALADELTKRYPEDTLINSIWLPAIRAAMSLQRSNAAQAIVQLDNTSRYEAVAEFWPQYLRGQAYLRLKQGAEAAMEFQKILDHRGYAPLSLLYSLAQLGLARSTSLTGDTARSQRAWQDFLTIWQKADPDLPILRAAMEAQGRRL